MKLYLFTQILHFSIMEVNFFRFACLISLQIRHNKLLNLHRIPQKIMVTIAKRKEFWKLYKLFIFCDNMAISYLYTS